MTVEYSLSQMQDNLRQSQAELLQILDSVTDAALHQPHGEENWSVAVMLAHLTEARPHMSGQAVNVVKNPGLSVGRPLDDEKRVEAIISAQRTDLSREHLKQQLLDSHQVMLQLLDSLNAADLQIPCKHVRFGEMTLGEFMQRTLVEHDQAHIEQARSFLK